MVRHGLHRGNTKEPTWKRRVVSLSGMSGADDELTGRRTGAPGDTPLTGFTIAVTAERRRDEQAVLLERRGARVVSVPVITHVPLLDDEALHEATRECIDTAPDLVVVNTGIGFRGWLEA